MSATPDADSPVVDVEETIINANIPVNQLTSRQLDALTAKVLRERGYDEVAAIIESKSGGLVSGVQAQASIGQQELVNRHLPRAPNYDKPDAATRLLSALSNDNSGRAKSTPPNTNTPAIKDSGSSQLLTGDPFNRQEAFRDLQAWVEGSLDMYKVRDWTFNLQHQAYVPIA